jgi:hypothetical protein
MPHSLIDLITAEDPALRNMSLDAWCTASPYPVLLAECEALDAFWRHNGNLYERVRALLFLHAIHRFHLPMRSELNDAGHIPYPGTCFLLDRRFVEAIDAFLKEQRRQGPSVTLSSALATAYRHLAFQTLADQVRRSVRSVPGNQWMFRMGHPLDHPLRIRPAFRRPSNAGAFPILHESTPVRMDLSHSAWSDIFFLGMDFPEGARVLNISIDLCVRGRDAEPRPPVNAYFRVIDEPVLRLVSLDLKTSTDVRTLPEMYDYARDYLGLLKAAVIASGLVPPGLESSEGSLPQVLAEMAGEGHGIELVSEVNGIPKGSRLAVSTNLLACLIAVCMRATGQTRDVEGPLLETERRLVAARAILGEWLAGSGGGWQDSGGLWPGIKLIEGLHAREGDLEYGISRGCLLPRHRILDSREVPASARDGLQQSLVLVHGGMAQDVGPVLEMVTEKYLLRSENEWAARQEAMRVLDRILDALSRNDIREVGSLTTHNFAEPLQTIIPWAGNPYTDALIDAARGEYGERFWGFWMLGGMSGGGMGFMFDPAVCNEAKDFMQNCMRQTKERLADAVPFAMDPVVYDFAINDTGSKCRGLEREAARLPKDYYDLMLPHWIRRDAAEMSPARKAEVKRMVRSDPVWAGLEHRGERAEVGHPETESQALEAMLADVGFDPKLQESIRSGLRDGQFGLAQNRLPPSSRIEDVAFDDVLRMDHRASAWEDAGRQALADGRIAVVTLAAGTGSRWTQGAGVVKALHPFSRFGGTYRNFLEVHLAKSRRSGEEYGSAVPHIFTTSYLTHEPIRKALERTHRYGYEGPLSLSPGRTVGVRMVPLVRDLRFLWEEMPQQRLDEQAQKVRESLHSAWIAWAHDAGEGSDYTDNVPMQCLHPVGHWFEISHLLQNGVLQRLLLDRPALQTLLLHNIDAVGTHVDPALLGLHLATGNGLTFEVLHRRIEDLGGGLASVDGRIRLVEGLAMPNEEAEFGLTYYNSMTTWIDIDHLLGCFALTREDLADAGRVSSACRSLAAKLPTYITIKDVKKRWGHGQEDIFPVSQYEKLWSDMSAQPGIQCGFVEVARARGQQLKDPAQLDGWLRDGSAAFTAALCEFGDQGLRIP